MIHNLHSNILGALGLPRKNEDGVIMCETKY